MAPGETLIQQIESPGSNVLGYQLARAFHTREIDVVVHRVLRGVEGSHQVHFAGEGDCVLLSLAIGRATAKVMVKFL